MRVLLDECIDWRLSRDIAGHEVMTARQVGWTTTKNGELLAQASQHFDAFVTVDRGLAFQQNVSTLPLAVIIMQAPTNRLADLQPLIPNLLAALKSAPKGVVTWCHSPSLPRLRKRVASCRRQRGG